MAATLTRARALAERLRVAGVPAVVDVRDAPAVLPGVLVPPPGLRFVGYAGPTVTWRLVALAADPTGSAQAWAELDQLVLAVADALPVESADPTAYQLGDASLPAYLLTLTESLDLTGA